jgi:hypothetical protein
MQPSVRVISNWAKSIVMLTVSRRWLLAVILRTHVRSAANLIWVAFAIKIPVDALIVVHGFIDLHRNLAFQTHAFSGCRQYNVSTITTAWSAIKMSDF